MPRSQEIFISYSRKDKEFVRRLDQALKSRGREAWVDWEDIRPTEEWMQAIYSAIEGADTFVFVLTPDSVALLSALDQADSVSITSLTAELASKCVAG
ncbi:MAG TPA: toll/interleukin-1 receptor domain-containing protein [Candidatus Udaeobacter sp.]|nr:toll/interleukin-1 receptor domain-containing protein [Candidatus Udaeobacter sp.]